MDAAFTMSQREKKGRQARDWKYIQNKTSAAWTRTVLQDMFYGTQVCHFILDDVASPVIISVLSLPLLYNCALESFFCLVRAAVYEAVALGSLYVI